MSIMLLKVELADFFSLVTIIFAQVDPVANKVIFQICLKGTF